MEKVVKTLRQMLNLGAFWIAVCASLAGMLTYTKAGLEAVFADEFAEQWSPRAARQPAVAQAAPVPAAAAQAPAAAALPPARMPSKSLPQAAAQPAPEPAAAPQLVAPPKRLQRTL